VPKDSKLTSWPICGARRCAEQGLQCSLSAGEGAGKGRRQYSEVEPVFLAPATPRRRSSAARRCLGDLDPFQAAAGSRHRRAHLVTHRRRVELPVLFLSKKFLPERFGIVDLVLAQLREVDEWAEGDIHAVANQLAPAIGFRLMSSKWP